VENSLVTVKILLGSAVILGALGFGAASFVETNVQYADFQYAIKSHRKVQVKGEWMARRESQYDAAQGTFMFSMRDEHGTEMNVVYGGARPNNFELAQSIVVKGTVEGNCFRATEILTKCPSKYEAEPSSRR
jgi:cytochrome c-type biogenesis protein CcmE